MFHQHRVWGVTPKGTPEEVARLLTETTRTLCTALELGGYLFLNDSTSEDGAQEYAVVRKPADPGGQYLQVESVTFGWCSYDQALGYVRSAIAGRYDALDFVRAVDPRLEPAAEHRRCPLCA